MSTWWSRRITGNNFDFLRIVAAITVLISHSYPLFGHQPEFFSFLSGYETGGGLAVTVFFFISGYLITGSFQRNRAVIRYGIARLLRILPGLATAVLFCTFIVGPIYTKCSFAEYLANPVTWSYMRNSLVFSQQFPLPGVFTDNPTANSVNGSLWTLPIEVTMYLLVPALFYLGALQRRVVLAVPVAFFAVLVIAQTYFGIGWENRGPTFFYSVPLFNFLGYGLFFFIGACFHSFRDTLVVDVRLASLALIIYVSTFHSPLGFAGEVVALPYLIYYIAFCPVPFWRFTNIVGDISYGFYIYAYPVQQAVVASTSGRLDFLE